MLTEDESLSLRSAVKLVLLILRDAHLPPDALREAEDALRRLMLAAVGSPDLPEPTAPAQRPAARAG